MRGIWIPLALVAGLLSGAAAGLTCVSPGQTARAADITRMITVGYRGSI